MTQHLSDAIFTTPEMREIFSADGQLRAMIEFEWGLTSALEETGFAEAGSADALDALKGAKFVDRDLLQREAVLDGNIAIPFLRQLTAAAAAKSGAAARSLHLGATSQDLLDTALVLQMREAFELLNTETRRLENALVRQVRAHAGTVMLGRTWLQPGPPTTFGLKLAGTLAALRRSQARVAAAQANALVLEFGGAVGTLSALGNEGARVSNMLARKLDLREPAIPWHSQRDNIAEVGGALSILTATLGKLAGDIALLMQAEVGEAAEATRGDGGGSSTMPHKQNPVACAAILAAARRAPGLMATLLGAMLQEHERGLGSWQAEWNALPELFCLAHGALSRAADLIEHLIVHPQRMKANIDSLRGIPMAEAVSIALAPALGRERAHALLREASRIATERNASLASVLKSMPEIRAHLTEEEIDALLQPGHYLGSARRFIDQVLGELDAGS